jgi:hypothetical protein
MPKPANTNNPTMPYPIGNTQPAPVRGGSANAPLQGNATPSGFPATGTIPTQPTPLR